MKVFIVEDDVQLLRSIKQKLMSADPDICICGEAFNGDLALKQIANNIPDIVITDIKMPVMDGLALIHILKTEYPDVIPIITSGYKDFEYAKQAMKLGVEEYLLKPVTIDALSRVLEECKQKLLVRKQQKDYAALYEVFHEQVEKKAFLSKQTSPISSSRDLVEAIEEYMKSNIEKIITLSMISSSFNFSTGYICRIFKNHKGLSPIDYFIKMKMEKAKEYLSVSPDLLVKDVANLLGYENPLYFSALFKKTEGISPSEYKKSSI